MKQIRAPPRDVKNNDPYVRIGFVNVLSGVRRCGWLMESWGERAWPYRCRMNFNMNFCTTDLTFLFDKSILWVNGVTSTLSHVTALSAVKDVSNFVRRFTEDNITRHVQAPDLCQSARRRWTLPGAGVQIVREKFIHIREGLRQSVDFNIKVVINDPTYSGSDVPARKHSAK